MTWTVAGGIASACGGAVDTTPVGSWSVTVVIGLGLLLSPPTLHPSVASVTDLFGTRKPREWEAGDLRSRMRLQRHRKF